MTRQDQNQLFAAQAAGSAPAARARPCSRWWAALASVILHGMLLAAIVFAHSGGPVGVTGAGPLSVFDVALLAPPNEAGQGAADPPPDPVPAQTHEPEAAAADAVPPRVVRPQQNDAQPTPARRPKRARTQDTVVSEMHGEDDARRQSVGGIAEQAAGGQAAPAAPGAAGGDGKPFGFSLGEVSGKPKVLKSVQVVYPVDARKKRITGQVLVRFHLDETGTVSHLHIKNAEPPDIFDRNTLAALRQWRFQPASHNSRAVPVWVELPIEFELR